MLGDAAIWSHSWYAYYGRIGTAGPAFNLAGGIQVGNSKYWIGDYTIQPENGGVGVFAHEYGHDLGLPDLYDTQGANDNAESFWTLMSDGSNLSDGTVDIGSKPCDMGVWEKFQLGWLNYQVASRRQERRLQARPGRDHHEAGAGPVRRPAEEERHDPRRGSFAGSKFYYSGQGDNLNNRMYQGVHTRRRSARLTAKVNYDIESGYDYANLIASTDGGATWKTVPTNLSTSTARWRTRNGIDGSIGRCVGSTSRPTCPPTRATSCSASATARTAH